MIWMFEMKDGQKDGSKDAAAEAPKKGDAAKAEEKPAAEVPTDDWLKW